jgi:SAM-dependent methyltransferase
MSEMLVPVDPALTEIRTLRDLIMLYQSRLDDPSVTTFSELMLMTQAYQTQAFALATELMGDLANCTSIAEIGCGCGCLLAYLRERGYRGDYLGIDLIAGFIEKAQSRFPDDKRARFVVGNFLEMQEKDLPRHDYYVAVSVFGYVPGANFMRDMVGKAGRLAEKGVVLTCNSTAHQVLPLTARTYAPADVVSMCMEYGKSLDFKHRCVPIDDSHYAMIGALIRP